MYVPYFVTPTSVILTGRRLPPTPSTLIISSPRVTILAAYPSSPWLERDKISPTSGFLAPSVGQWRPGDGSSKLDPWAVECRMLRYAGGSGNYKVQDLVSQHVFVSQDIVFEEGQPHRTSPSVGENFKGVLGFECQTSGWLVSLVGRS